MESFHTSHDEASKIVPVEFINEKPDNIQANEQLITISITPTEIPNITIKQRSEHEDNLSSNVDNMHQLYLNTIITSDPVNTPNKPTLRFSNNGKKWPISEDVTLITELDSGISISKIAKNHGRTELAIEYRIARHLIKYNEKERAEKLIQWKFSVDRYNELKQVIEKL